MPERVLVVGATSAIAAEVARRYARDGASLYLVARNEAKLIALADELGSAVAGHRAADLADLDRASSLVDGAVHALGSIDVALVAHGDLGDQLRSEHDLDEAMRTLTVNLSSAVALLIPLANHMEGRGRGHLGVITSVAGVRGRPRNYTYGAAKGGLSHYLEGLRSRLVPSGVVVHDFRLGPVDTPMTVGHAKNALFAQPGPVADAVVRGLASRQFTIYVPGFWRWIMWGFRNTPEPIFQRLGFLSGR